MDAQDIRNLQEAYVEVVENQQLDELTPATPRNIRRLVKKRKEDAQRAKDRTGHNFTPEYKKYFQTTQRQKVTDIFSRPSSRPRSVEPASTNEQYDLYDIILSHLLDEGYAETPEAAEAIMVNMGEEWREDIVEGYKERPVEKMKKKAMKIVDDPEYDGEPESVWRHQQILKHATRSAKSREAAKRKSQKNVDKYWEKEDR